MSKDKVLPAVHTPVGNEWWRGKICPLPKEPAQPKPKKGGKK